MPQLIAPFSDELEWMADHMGPAEFLPSSWFTDLITDFACDEHISPLEIICENLVFMMSGYDG
jgi:hypothetical protein